MKRKFLEDLGLEKETIDKIMTENGADIEAEKAKTTAATTKLDDIMNQLNEANNTIKDLKKNNEDNEALQTKVKEYETNMKNQKKEYDEKVRNLTLDAAIEKALLNSNAKHTDLLSSKIDRAKLVINDDKTITGLDEQLTGLKENYKDLFETTVSGKTPNNTGGSDPEAQINDLGSALSAYYQK